jgi:hypothetical protein
MCYVAGDLLNSWYVLLELWGNSVLRQQLPGAAAAASRFHDAPQAYMMWQVQDSQTATPRKRRKAAAASDEDVDETAV